MTKNNTIAKPRRNHPARGARIVALTSSILATGGVAGALAYYDGALPTTDPASEITAVVPAAAPSAASPPNTTSAPWAQSTSTETTSPQTDDTRIETGQSDGELADGIWLGTASYTKWGDVQVEVTIESNQITEVTTVRLPSDRKSTRINDLAVPMLETQAISLQSADLDTVSGATYTSVGYADSLQAALDQSATAQEIATS